MINAAVLLRNTSRLQVTVCSLETTKEPAFQEARERVGKGPSPYGGRGRITANPDKAPRPALAHPNALSSPGEELPHPLQLLSAPPTELRRPPRQPPPNLLPQRINHRDGRLHRHRLPVQQIRLVHPRAHRVQRRLLKLLRPRNHLQLFNTPILSDHRVQQDFPLNAPPRATIPP